MTPNPVSLIRAVSTPATKKIGCKVFECQRRYTLVKLFKSIKVNKLLQFQIIPNFIILIKLPHFS